MIKSRQQVNSDPQSSKTRKHEPRVDSHQDINPFIEAKTGIPELANLSTDHRSRLMYRLQQTGGNASVKNLLQRDNGDNVVVGQPLTVTATSQRGAEQGVSNLDSLATGLTVSHGAAVTSRNAPNPSNRLPFDRTGQSWDANVILTTLGQYDRISGTDSDSDRCVQAVAMASYIPRGPSSLTGFIASAIMDGMMTQTMNTRRRTAISVLRNVEARISAGSATYGDLSWAQESLHALFYSDDQAPSEDEAMGRITPTMSNLSRTTQTLDIWCNSPADVITQANLLSPGGQLILTGWRVTFNHTFQLVRDQGHRVHSPMTVNLNGRSVRIRRIDATSRPRPNQIDPNRDRRQGHQIMVLRDNQANGPLRLYEPEVTSSGQHLAVLNAGALARYYRHDAAASTYRYVHIIGRIDPRDPMSLPSSS